MLAQMKRPQALRHLRPVRRCMVRIAAFRADDVDQYTPDGAHLKSHLEASQALLDIHT